MKKVTWFIKRLFLRRKTIADGKTIINLNDGYNPSGLGALKIRVSRLCLGEEYKFEDNLIHTILGNNKADGTYYKAGRNKLMWVKNN